MFLLKNKNTKMFYNCISEAEERLMEIGTGQVRVLS